MVFILLSLLKVKSEIIVEEKEIKIAIKEFRSKYYKDEEGIILGNFESLSAVFIDKSYNDIAFELDEVYFADDLINNDNSDIDIRNKLKNENIKTLSIPPIDIKSIGKKIMIIYTDIFGNDFTEIFEVREGCYNARH